MEPALPSTLSNTFGCNMGHYGIMIIIWNVFDLHLLFEILGQNARMQEARKMARAQMDLESAASVSINRS